MATNNKNKLFLIQDGGDEHYVAAMGYGIAVAYYREHVRAENNLSEEDAVVDPDSVTLVCEAEDFIQ